MGFAKGHIAWNKGKPLSEEHKRKIDLTRFGRPGWNKGLTYTLGKKKPKQKRICIICGEEFELGHNKKKKCCSSECRIIRVGQINIGNQHGFKKGNVPLNKGKHKIPEVKLRTCIVCGGNFKVRVTWPKQKCCSPKCSAIYVGQKLTGRTYKRTTPAWNKGRPDYEHRGEKCHLWKGGISFEPYGIEFNRELKEQTRERDGHKCQGCFKPQDESKKKLDVHHIDYDKKNSNPINLISLCKGCHTKTNQKRAEWSAYFQRLTAGIILAA